jgi:glutathione S-transferase
MHEKNVPYVTVDVDPKQARALAVDSVSQSSCLSYWGTPAFEDGDVRLYDSTVICEYLEEKYPQPNLMGSDPLERSAVRSMLWDLNVRRIQPLAKLAAMLFYDRVSRDQARVERQLSRWHAYLDELDDHFRTTQWLSIDRFSVADISAYTTVAVSRGLGANVTRGRRHLRAWLGRVDSRSSVVAAAPDAMPEVA